MSIKMMFQGASDFNGSLQWGWTRDAGADTFVLATMIFNMLVLQRWCVAIFASTMLLSFVFYCRLVDSMVVEWTGARLRWSINLYVAAAGRRWSLGFENCRLCFGFGSHTWGQKSCPFDLALICLGSGTRAKYQKQSVPKVLTTLV